MKVFFVGIKGSGMSSLAMILKGLGHEVSGSDIDKFVFTEIELLKNGIEILPFGEVDFADADFDEIIIGNSFRNDHPEVVSARGAGTSTEIKKYFDKVNELSVTIESIAVAGTNGKTTTTGLLVQSLKDAEPSYLIGDGHGAGNKASDLFLFEACEYRETFLSYHPDYLIINNIEMDHPDFFQDVEHVIGTFQKFADQSKIVILNSDDENANKIEHDKVYRFGTKGNPELKADSIVYSEKGIAFELTYQGKSLGEFTLPFYGEYMLYNSLGVILVNLLLGRDIDLIIENLKQFEGVSRRFNEIKLSEEREVVLVDDYAHHPTAIRLTLEAIRQKYPDYKLVTIFQPHTYSRTAEFMDEFAEVLSVSDQVILAEIFGSARESSGEISIDDLADKINRIDENLVIDVGDITGDEEKVVIAMLGAGDVDVIYKDKLMKKFSEE